MTAIWASENKFRIWFEIEAHACDAQAELGVIPKEAAQAIWEQGAFDVDRIDEIERETKHDVIAFLTNLAEHVGEDARFVHQGMTSSDVLDTCLSVQLVQATDILLADLDRVLDALKKRAYEFKYTPTMGRSHGIHAEPTTFGLKLAGHYAEFDRNRDRLQQARAEIATCAISGAVGTFANIDPAVEDHVAKKLGLMVEPVSTQVIPRDRHAMFFATLGVVASSIENFATEIRHLQRTEVREVEEYFSEKQKGSSAMPHKRNPILSENLTGLARNIRASVTPALENVTLWHERDISHSSVERVIFPDSCTLLNYMLHKLTDLTKGLIVYPKNMAKNLGQSLGMWNSQSVLLALRWPLRGPGCTGIFATNTADGTVVHARNMDLAPVKLFAPLVYEGVFTRNGSVVFRAEMVAGYVSLLTGYRPGAYVVERNTRYPSHRGGNREMLDNLLDGVPLLGWTLRRTLESISTYDEALAKVQSAPFVATEYVVMSGVRRGHIVARDPASVAHLSTLGSAAYVIVTNFDYWWHDVREYFDPTGGHVGLPRRVAAQRILNASLNAGLALTPEVMNATISADGVLADTIFQAVADVEVGLWAIAQPVL